MDVYLEIGRRRVFAAAVDWPGLARSGKDEQQALEALLAYAERYRRDLAGAAAKVALPTRLGDLRVVERLVGDATTDFGAPGAIPSADHAPPDDAGLARLIEVMEASWRTFDRAVESATGRELAAAGPRGGGRDLAKMIEHVEGADASYLRSLGGAMPEDASWPEVRRVFVDALGARARGELPETGPRGGRRWPAAYAVRRAAGHLLDHAWELKDRLSAGGAR